MTRKLKLILMLVSLSVCLCLMSSTYSRYVANTNGDISFSFSKWQILVEDIDITGNTDTTIPLTPVIETQDYAKEDVVAPTSKGHFDINIDPSNVDVSFSYNIDLEIDNEKIPDLMITKYSILPSTYIEEDELEILYSNENNIKNSLIFDKDDTSFKFEPFTIRIYFEWYNGEDEIMNDNEDTQIGYLAATEDLEFQMNANISFEQILEED